MIIIIIIIMGCYLRLPQVPPLLRCKSDPAHGTPRWDVRERCHGAQGHHPTPHGTGYPRPPHAHHTYPILLFVPFFLFFPLFLLLLMISLIEVYVPQLVCDALKKRGMQCTTSPGQKTRVKGGREGAGGHEPQGPHRTHPKLIHPALDGVWPASAHRRPEAEQKKKRI